MDKMDNEIRNTIERLRLKAEMLLSENSRTFIVDINNSYYFCDIIVVGENKISFKPFKGNDVGKVVTKYWADIIRVEEYMEVLD